MTFDNISQSLINFGLAFVPALFGIICHEVAHGYVAYRQGDPTAKALGRLTLNPIPHLDPTGTMVFALTALSNVGFVIGWAKPVPIQPRFFKRPKEGMMLVSVAGPLANFMVALLCAFIYRLAGSGEATAGLAHYISESAAIGIVINCTLAWFNLIPIPPMDGSHILGGLLPESLARPYRSLGRYGMLIIIGLLAFGAFGVVLRPLVRFSVSLICSLVGVPL